MIEEKTLYKLKPLEILIIGSLLIYKSLRLEGLHEILKSRGIYVTANQLRHTLYRLERKGFIERRKTVGRGNSNKMSCIIYSLSYSFKRSKKIRRMFEEIFVGLRVGE